MIKFLLDENIPIRLKEVLYTYGYNSSTIKEVGLNAENDLMIVDYIIKEKSTLITFDFDFKDYYFNMLDKEMSIILVKRYSQKFTILKHIIINTISKGLFDQSKLRNSLLVLSEEKVERYSRGREQ